MIQWSELKDFSDEFLAKYQDLILYDVLHQVKAFLLFPLHCTCEGFCACAELRQKVILSLNTHLFNRESDREKDLERLYMMRMLLQIPEDSYFRKNYGEAYPLWLLQEELKKRDMENHFKVVSRLIWTCVRLGKTSKSFFNVREASLNEAMDFILGKNPLKTNIVEFQKPDYLCGEKKIAAFFKKYKSICHFVAAFERMREEEGPNDSFLFELHPRPHKIKRFLSLAQWFKEQLLLLKTPNTKEKSFFTEDNLLSLPPWITSDKVNIIIDPIEEKTQQLLEKMKGPFRSTKESKF